MQPVKEANTVEICPRCTEATRDYPGLGSHCDACLIFVKPLVVLRDHWEKGLIEKETKWTKSTTF